MFRCCAVALLALVALSCQRRDSVFGADCGDDGDCGSGFVCAADTCVPDDVGGVGEEGEGEEGEGEEGEGEERGDGVLGDVCANDAACAVGFVCGSFFSGDLAKTCLPQCAGPGTSCTVTSGRAGTCQQFQTITTPVCFGEGALLGLCGNGVSSGCAQVNGVTPGCAVGGPNDPNTPFDDGNVGFCILPCEVGNTCSDATLACSNDVAITVDADTTVGVCVAPTALGDPCGAAADGSLTLCGGAQDCSVEGTCTPEEGAIP